MGRDMAIQPEFFTGAADSAALSSYEVPQSVQVQIADAAYSGRVIVGALGRKLFRKLAGCRRGLQPVAVFNGVVVFDRPELHGGGLTDGQGFLRALHTFGIAPCARLFEFCSGPGYIGYYLLANGYCRTLALADINADAIRAAKATARFNGLDRLVAAYVSDALDSIPADERWDVVVGIPPWSLGKGALLCHDPGYELHRRFYAEVKRFMRPGGRIVLMEGSSDCDPSVFPSMIAAGGGRFLGIDPMTTLRGERTNPSFVISQW
jgi:SAM-dependent methyltransferase